MSKKLTVPNPGKRLNGDHSYSLSVYRMFSHCSCYRTAFPKCRASAHAEYFLVDRFIGFRISDRACLEGQEIFGKLGYDRFYFFCIALYSAGSRYDFGRTVFHPQMEEPSGKAASLICDCLTDFSDASVDYRAAVCLIAQQGHVGGMSLHRVHCHCQ